MRPGLDRHSLKDKHVGPVVLSYKENEDIEQWMVRVVEQKECYASWKTEDGREHGLWRVERKDGENGDVVKMFEPVEKMYILDGHHRL